MSEKAIEKFDRCMNCPNLGKISKMLARVGGLPEIADGCEGPVEVSHGQVVTQVRRGNEPSPPEKTWNVLVGSADPRGERRYSRTDWTSEDVCGREEDTIAPREGEVPYKLGVHIKTNHEGRRVAAFIKGDEEEIREIRGTQAMIELLDSVDDMVDAYNANDIDGMIGVQDSVNAHGLSIGAVAGRGVAPRGAVLIPDEIIDDRSSAIDGEVISVIEEDSISQRRQIDG